MFQQINVYSLYINSVIISRQKEEQKQKEFVETSNLLLDIIMIWDSKSNYTYTFFYKKNFYKKTYKT